MLGGGVEAKARMLLLMLVHRRVLVLMRDEVVRRDRDRRDIIFWWWTILQIMSQRALGGNVYSEYGTRYSSAADTLGTMTRIFNDVNAWMFQRTKGSDRIIFKSKQEDPRSETLI
jgi:hypothetical protein